MFSKKSDQCPYFRSPCIRERCKAWYTGVVDETTSAGTITKAHSDCVEFFWKPLYLKGMALRADGTQHAVESMRNEIVKRMDANPVLPRPTYHLLKEVPDESDNHPGGQRRSR